MTENAPASIPQGSQAEPDAAAAPQQLTGTRIVLADINVQAGERTLLQNASAEFPAGQVTLLLGCSGVGKSVLLRILAGLATSPSTGIRYAGDVHFEQADGSHRTIDDGDAPVAVVFQNYALFDELTPVENVQIALDHCRTTGWRGNHQAAVELLRDLAVPMDRPTAVMSGGQQQRLAIARAIGMETDVVFYDEPTSGLDTRTASRVAELIRSTQLKFRRTTVIVTHDYEALMNIADHIVLIDHLQQKLVPLVREHWNQLPAILGEPPAADEPHGSGPGIPALIRKNVAALAVGTGQIVTDILRLPADLLPLWKSFRWGLRATAHYLNLVAGPSACAYMMIAGVILGFVAQDFIFRYLPFRQFTEPLLIENLLQGTGFSLYRFLVPILATILIAARSGAAVSADIGSKVYGNQIDAIRTIGMRPWQTLR
ncbi:MAG: ATP-binding cassette domain-containing protein, partial [Planctomycetaceae bacterium]|nr:ATP-binding cassette domain-containing protein [Planctomycetaceae bacterium]